MAAEESRRDPSSLVDIAGLDEVRARLEAFDEQREQVRYPMGRKSLRQMIRMDCIFIRCPCIECALKRTSMTTQVPLPEVPLYRVYVLPTQVIKACRDIQKDAKNAIYSLHRNDIKRGSALLSKCEEVCYALGPGKWYSPISRFHAFMRCLRLFIFSGK